MTDVLGDRLRSELRGEVESGVLLAGLTTYRVGGPADLLVHPADMADLRRAVTLVAEAGMPLFILGGGSNLLVRDGGFRGVVVSLARGLKGIECEEETRLRCGAGAALRNLVAEAASRGLAGVEFLATIPGTVGGAVRMNAGAFGREMKDVIETVDFVTPAGEVVARERASLCFGYRTFELAEGWIIAGCTLNLKAEGEETVRERMRDYSARRGGTQPLGRPTAGSVFKNPEGDYAGRLIEAAGLKGLTLGGAMISERHANFIENRGGATAADIEELMEIVRERVYKESGIRLEAEVKTVGEALPLKAKAVNG